MSQWELTVEQFNDYLADLNLKAAQVVKELRSSQISRELE